MQVDDHDYTLHLIKNVRTKKKECVIVKHEVETGSLLPLFSTARIPLEVQALRSLVGT
jgi:hypothetical protein